MAAGEIGASWFEARVACHRAALRADPLALLTMKVGNYGFRAFATWSTVTTGAALPKELRM
jgi:hypothetical protein